MLNLRFWIHEQGLSVKQLALGLEAPLPTVEDWVYRGTAPSTIYMTRLTEFISAECKHHWIIATANGPVSEGVCQRCGEEKSFINSVEFAYSYNSARPKATMDSAGKLTKP